MDRKTLRHSSLGYELADVRIALRARLMAPILRDALGNASDYRDPDQRAVRTMLGLLARNDEASDGPDDAENTGNEAENHQTETKNDGNQ